MYYVPGLENNGDEQILWINPYKTLREALAEAINNIETHKGMINIVFIFGPKMKAVGLVLKSAPGRTYKWYAYPPGSNKTAPPVTLNMDGTFRKPTGKGRR